MNIEITSLVCGRCKALNVCVTGHKTNTVYRIGMMEQFSKCRKPSVNRSPAADPETADISVELEWIEINMLKLCFSEIRCLYQ